MRKNLKWAGIAALATGTMLTFGACGVWALIGLGVGALVLLGGVDLAGLTGT